MFEHHGSRVSGEARQSSSLNREVESLLPHWSEIAERLLQPWFCCHRWVFRRLLPFRDKEWEKLEKQLPRLGVSLGSLRRRCAVVSRP